MSMFTKLPSQFYDATAFDAFSVDRDFYLGTAKAMAWLSQLAYETDQSKKIEGILSTWKLRLVDVVASEEVAKELAMNLTWWSEHPSKLPLLLLTAVVTHLLMSFSQTVMHYGLGHRRLGGIFFRNHIHFHHVHYSKDHLVSLTRIKNAGNNTPFFVIPVALMLSSTYIIFPLGIFLIQIITAFASFSAHVYLDKQYHIGGSPLLRFAWFRRKQQLHFVHHKHANSNFAIIDNFWDRLLGTYRSPDAGDARPRQLLWPDKA